MALPRPSLTLVLDIDERLDSEALRLEIGRCYAHVCQTLVRTHPADTAAAASTHAVAARAARPLRQPKRTSPPTRRKAPAHKRMRARRATSRASS